MITETTNLDELSMGIPTPLPTPGRAYLHSEKVRVMARLLDAWSLIPGMRLGQLLYIAAVSGDEHLSQISDGGLANAVELWSEQYK